MSNARVVKVSKLVDGINIGFKEYNLARVFIKRYDPSKVAIYSDNFETSFNKNKSPTNIALRLRKVAVLNTNFAHQIKGDDDGISKLCASCVGSELT